jgi:hypothetical protein
MSKSKPILSAERRADRQLMSLADKIKKTVKKTTAKNFDYGTGSAPKFARKKKAAKKPRDRKAAAKKGASTRKRNLFNKIFDYGASTIATPVAAPSKAAKRIAMSLFRGF